MFQSWARTARFFKHTTLFLQYIPFRSFNARIAHVPKIHNRQMDQGQCTRYGGWSQPRNISQHDHVVSDMGSACDAANQKFCSWSNDLLLIPAAYIRARPRKYLLPATANYSVGCQTVFSLAQERFMLQGDASKETLRMHLGCGAHDDPLQTRCILPDFSSRRLRLLPTVPGSASSKSSRTSSCGEPLIFEKLSRNFQLLPAASSATVHVPRANI